MFSKVVRRTHMFLALFLTPWMLIYAVSTMTMNHRKFFQEMYGGVPRQFEKVNELTYDGTFPANAPPRVMGQQILLSLGLDGSHGVQLSPDKSQLIINRFDAVAPRRITFTPADNKVLIEKEVFRTNAFLERMHRRRGYQTGYAADNAWAFSVDLVIFAMVFWVASGLWMWWEMKLTRSWGTVFGIAGMALFGLFLFTI